MGFLFKIAALAMFAFVVWKTAKHWMGLFGIGQKPPPPPVPPRQDQPPQPQPRRVVVEDTRMCTACSAYVSTDAAKCGRSDCPQAA
jgi:hypothetical protein